MAEAGSDLSYVKFNDHRFMLSLQKLIEPHSQVLQWNINRKLYYSKTLYIPLENSEAVQELRNIIEFFPTREFPN